MKKYFLLSILSALLLLGMVSCGSAEKCPAYSAVETAECAQDA